MKFLFIISLKIIQEKFYVVSVSFIDSFRVSTLGRNQENVGLFNAFFNKNGDKTAQYVELVGVLQSSIAKCSRVYLLNIILYLISIKT